MSLERYLEATIRTIVKEEIARLETTQAQLPLPIPEKAAPSGKAKPLKFLSPESVAQRKRFALLMASRPEGVTKKELANALQIDALEKGLDRHIGKNGAYGYLHELENAGLIRAEPNTDPDRGKLSHGKLPGGYVYRANKFHTTEG